MDLKNRLKAGGIDTSQYGIGKAKTLEHLLEEIKAGEMTLAINEEGILLRRLIITSTEIYYTNPQKEKFKLKEEKQIFFDGRERARDFVGSVSGKIKGDESPEHSAKREIEEELGISSPLIVIDNGKAIETKETASYPGLLSEYTIYKFIVHLEDKDFKPEGYIEKKDGLTTFFVWEKVV